MKFPYVHLGDSDMPIIPVTLNLGENYIVTEALVDSGAASCIFDAQFAEVLGITDLVENGQEIVFEGISGHTLTGYCHDVTLIIGGYQCPRIRIAFSRDMPDNAVNILGQQGFFELFPIKFTYGKKEIDVMFEA